MATTEHCLLCFEALAAHLQDRKPMTLAEIESSWAEYVKIAPASGSSASKTKLAKRLPALHRVADASSGSSSSAASSTTSLQQSPSSSSSSPSAAVDTPGTSASSLPAVTESPLFVTWNTVDDYDDDDENDYDNEQDQDEDEDESGLSLRGCIGTFEAQPLEEGIPSFALTSALHDTRFPPVAARELPSLRVSVTLLTNFEDAADADDWEVGRHGLRISFAHRGRRYSSTYLPDVAAEQGWTKEETLVSLMRKAGWMGRRDGWRDVPLRVVRYQGKKASLPWGRYKRWREWASAHGSK